MIVESDNSRAWVLRYELRRLLQTPRAFSNWPGLLAGVAREKVAEGPEVLTFHARSGQTISIPNAPGARVPVYEVFAEDCYDLRWFLGDLIDRPIHVLDVGAHVGTFATQLAATHPSATIDCFEPAPDTYQYLKSNVEVNGNGERIHTYQKALTGEHGFAILDLQGAGSGHNHLAFEDHLDGSGVRVETVPFDDVVANARGPVELIKMDCEGGEYELVYKSSKESWANVQRLVLEYHTMPDESWEELRAWFASVGLHVLRDLRSPIAGTAWLSRTPLRDHDGSGPRGLASKVAHNVRRVRQTRKTFSNWPSLLSGLVREKVGVGPSELTFETRSGQKITVPNVPGARVPTYEQYAEEEYKLDWFTEAYQGREINAFDVGAHVGTFACSLVEVLPTVSVTCFEPSAGTASYLRRNIEQNGLGSRITVVDAALAGETGFALFDDHGGASGLNNLVDHKPVDDAPYEGAGVKVPTISFDEAIAAAPGPITLVKMDCEGGEYGLVYNSSPESWANVERVVLEYHDVPGESWAELRAWFAGVGLHLVGNASYKADLGLAWLARGPVGFPKH
ncbi:FkbM family methyltransferase [Nocardioides marmoriginsengisoli]|uniref:FkbM family methyltransferase n=1 Tax=Nocardioides marmoriginsengisoli TaxID=661483 RepID=A0A3N0CK04_9ACTN|nr:FkbM family methyltransferase [Nocardioides marmoriginsengisoli]RNL63774.1 FkbM family methyltransferase [Nocardioides marmoriginsengisoli]